MATTSTTIVLRPPYRSSDEGPLCEHVLKLIAKVVPVYKRAQRRRSWSDFVRKQTPARIACCEQGHSPVWAWMHAVQATQKQLWTGSLHDNAGVNAHAFIRWTLQSSELQQQ